MSELDSFEHGQANDVERAVMAFARHKVTGPFDPERGACDSARPSIADTLRCVICDFGSNRRHWPRRVLEAAAPFDPLAQLALGGTEARRVYTRPPASAIHPPAHVRTHRPHNPNAGIDWHPVVPTDDLAIPAF